MRSTLVRQLAIIVGLFVFVFAFAQPVSAVKPFKVTFFVDETLPEPLEICDGFDVIHSHQQKVTVTTFFNKDGDPIRIVIKVLEFSGTYTNSVDGSKSISQGHAPSVIRIDLQKGTFTAIGRPAHIILPGQGVVIHDTGIVIFDFANNKIFEGGPHEFLNGEASFCDLLA